LRSLRDRLSIRVAQGYGTAGRIRRHFSSLGAGPLGLAILMLSLTVGNATATVFHLENGNSLAQFHTEASDGPVLGHNVWEVDGIDHMAQQWFAFRTAETGREFFVGGDEVGNPLSQITAHSINLDGQPGDDFLRVIYRDNADQFEIQLMYFLTGGTPGSNNSLLREIISITNLAGGGGGGTGGGGEGEGEEENNDNLNIGFFQLSNFDLEDTAENDSVIISGNMMNVATQFEANTDLHVAESVVSPPPTFFEAGEHFDIMSRFTDNDFDDLNGNASAINTVDAVWAFQWNFEIAPDEMVLISKEKMLEEGPINIAIPLPSAAWCGFVLFGSVGMMRRILRPGR